MDTIFKLATLSHSPKVRNQVSTLPAPTEKELINEIEREQQTFVIFSDKMFTLNSDLQSKRQRFLKRLTDNLGSIKITGTLERFDELELKQFVAELKKQKITLSLKQQDEWEEYFSEYKKECNYLAIQIQTMDNEIAAMVYALYGLSEEEIGIIKGGK